jgi:two-component system, NarL family, nitrate/nitrite response regulator NarL
MTAEDAGCSPKAAVVTKPVLVFVICRVHLYHDALIRLLNRQAGMSAVGSTEMDDGLISSLEAITPDTVLLDLGSPEALPFAARLVRARPSTRILGFGIDEAPPQVIACAEAGLRGYVPSHASIADLASAARRIALGDTVCSTAMADKLFHHLRSVALRGPALSTKSSLTGRQQQILALINEGLSNKQIAQRLSLGPSTVKNHVHGLLSRLHVARRTEAIASIRQDSDAVFKNHLEIVASRSQGPSESKGPLAARGA